MGMNLLKQSVLENGYLLDLTIKSTLLVVLAACLVLLLNRASAALRHRIWSLLFLALLILPLVTGFAPRWNWQIIPRAWQQTTPVAAAPERPAEPAPQATVAQHEPTRLQADPDLPQPAEQKQGLHLARPQPVVEQNTAGAPAAAVPVFRPALTEPPMVWTEHVLTLLWLAGVLLTLLPVASGLLGNRRLKKRSRLLDSPAWERTLSSLSQRLDLKRPVTLLAGGTQQMPVTFGWWRPSIILPAEAESWTEERLQIVLLHELAHIQRCDVPLQLLARLGCTLFWFNPLVWWAAHRMRLEREHACDDCVLQAGQDPSLYASQLLEIARQLSNQSSFASAALSMARKSQLEGRLLAVLDNRRNRNQVGGTRAWGVLLLALLTVSVLGIIHPTLQGDSLLAAAEKNKETTVSNTDSENLMRITGIVLSAEGEPVSGANIDLQDDARGTRWNRSVPGVDDFEFYQTSTDENGQFQFVLPHDLSRPRNYMQLIASLPGGLLDKVRVKPELAQQHFELKFPAAKKVRLQLIDTVGNPVSNIAPYLNGLTMGNDNYIMLQYPKPDEVVKAWPRFSPSDQDGYTEALLPASIKVLNLYINDPQLGAHSLDVNVTDEPISVALQPAQFLNGKVIDEKNGQPLAGADVMFLEGPFRNVRTQTDGSFRIARGETIRGIFPSGHSILHVYPAPESAYLFQALEWKWPNNRLSDAELTIKMKQGIVITGRVAEKQSGKPISNAQLWFESQEYNNPLFDETSRCRFFGADMKYTTDAEGRFQMPVWPGPGYLIVTAPTLDYVHQEISLGDKYYGKPGMRREYYDSVTRLELQPAAQPEPLNIKLERGITLRRQIVRPDGKLTNGKAFSRSYLPFRKEIDAYMPAILFQDGHFEFPGFNAQKSMPLYFLDLEHHCGKIITRFNAAENPIQLEPCGAATFQFEDNNGKPLVNYEPFLMVIVRPGTTPTSMIEPDQPFWFDHMYWQNILRPEQGSILQPERVAKTDAEGRVTIKDLIPGATYQLMFIKKGRWASGHEFTVEPGKTTDIGKVVLELQ